MSGFGQVLKEVGEFGAFQKRLLIAICIPNIFTAFHMFGQVFTSLNFSHHCNTDWIQTNGPNLTKEQQQNLTIPLNKDGEYESCKMFTEVDWDIESIKTNGINSTTKCTNGWDYEAPQDTTSLVSEVGMLTEILMSFKPPVI